MSGPILSKPSPMASAHVVSVSCLVDSCGFLRSLWIRRFDIFTRMGVVRLSCNPRLCPILKRKHDLNFKGGAAVPGVMPQFVVFIDEVVPTVGKRAGQHLEAHSLRFRLLSAARRDTGLR